jgi:mono/diheme cytochrome c family protein
VNNVRIVGCLLLAALLSVAACAKNQGSSGGGSSAATATSAGGSEMAANAGVSPLPIPLAKLPAAKVAPGNASAGAAVFAANCASCHGTGGKNGSVGPQLAGMGLTAGQVAYMVRNPQAIDKESAMPKLPLTDKQVADVAAYVASLK